MKPNTFLLIAAILILLTGMFLGGFIQRKFIAEPCLELIKSDTIRVVIYDSATVKNVVKSQPKKTLKYRRSKEALSFDSAKIAALPCDTAKQILTQLMPLADTSFYSDTLRNDTSHNIVVNDTIVGHRIGLGVEFKNLRPLVKETVTNTVVKKKQWVLYGLIQIPIGKQVSVIPTVEITTPFGLCFGYGYNALNNSHVPNVGYAIKFNQK